MVFPFNNGLSQIEEIMLAYEGKFSQTFSDSKFIV